jgi:signal transduction histidine kinase
LQQTSFLVSKRPFRAVHVYQTAEIRLYSESPSGSYVRVTITDNGCGKDHAAVERIFDPFFATKPAGKGTG